MIDVNQLPEFDPAEYLEDDEDISLGGFQKLIQGPTNVGPFNLSTEQ